VSYAIALAGALVLTVSSSWTMAIIAVLMLGAGFAPVFPVMFAYIGGLYPDLTGTAFGIALVIGLAGNMLLNYLVGILAHAIGIGSYPVLLVAAVLMGLLLFRIGLSRVPAAIRT